MNEEFSNQSLTPNASQVNPAMFPVSLFCQQHAKAEPNVKHRVKHVQKCILNNIKKIWKPKQKSLQMKLTQNYVSTAHTDRCVEAKQSGRMNVAGRALMD